jgi:hypothetical protein
MPVITLRHYGRSHPILAGAMIHHNPEYKKVLS